MSVTPAEVLASIWGTQKGHVFLPRREGGRWIEADTSLAWPSRDIAFGSAQQGDLYFCPLVFSQPRRRAEHALPPRVLWADLDACDPRKMGWPPSIWYESSGGRWQGIWLLSQRLTPRAAAELSRRIAYTEGADKGGWDLTQVLRIPGSLNHKYDPPQRVKLGRWSQAPIDPHAIARVYPALPTLPALDQHGQLEWPDESAERIALAVAGLPAGVRLALSAPLGEIGDRSMHIHTTARLLVTFGLDRNMAAHVLNGSTAVESKYGGRKDRHARVLAEIEQAIDARARMRQ